MLLASAVLLAVVGLVHSVLAELTMFRQLPRATGLAPLGFPPIAGAAQSPVLTVRACWHLLTVFGWTFALILGRFAAQPTLTTGDRFIVQSIAAALAAAAVVMFVGTRGKHLGWAAFAAAAALAYLGL